MHVCSRGRRMAPAISLLWVAALLVFYCTGTAFAAVNSKPKPKHRVSVAGTWSGQYSGAFTGTFTLHWTLSKSSLSGSIVLSNPNGTYSVTGSVHGTAITFGAVGAGATYTGSQSGKSMSGSYKTPRGVGTWSAHKTS